MLSGGVYELVTSVLLLMYTRRTMMHLSYSGPDESKVWVRLCVLLTEPTFCACNRVRRWLGRPFRSNTAEGTKSSAFKTRRIRNVPSEMQEIEIVAAIYALWLQ